MPQVCPSKSCNQPPVCIAPLKHVKELLMHKIVVRQCAAQHCNIVTPSENSPIEPRTKGRCRQQNTLAMIGWGTISKTKQPSSQSTKADSARWSVGLYGVAPPLATRGAGGAAQMAPEAETKGMWSQLFERLYAPK
eukprot:6019193-Pleurochrysis_carterae.AAC.2